MGPLLGRRLVDCCHHYFPRDVSGGYYSPSSQEKKCVAAPFIVSATHAMADYHVGRSSQAVRVMVIGNVGHVETRVRLELNTWRVPDRVNFCYSAYLFVWKSKRTGDACNLAT